MIIEFVTAAALSIAAHDVTDGDTFRMPNGEKIRISNIDTPEQGAKAKCDAERFLAVHARAGLIGLLGLGGVEITREPRQTDPYGRTLARVSVRGRDVGQSMVNQMLAVQWAGRRHSWCGPYTSGR